MRRAITGAAATIGAILFLLAPSAASAATPGVQAHLLWSRVDSADVERQLDLLVNAGAEVVRVDVGWSSLESKGDGVTNTWYLSKLDTVVAEAEERGLKLLLTFSESPCWASSAPETLKQGCEGSWWDRGVQRYGPSDPAEYAEALAFLIKRYGHRVTAWEIWNEPNHPDFLRGGDQLGQYSRLLKTAYPVAKAADPNAVIVGGSLAGSDVEFTSALFARGIKDHFDVWSIHPYNEDRSPLDPGFENYIKTSFIRGVPAVRKVLVDNGDAEPMWLTEFGWSTCTVRDEAHHRNCNSEAQQADYLPLAYQQMENWAYVKVGIWFNLQDMSYEPAKKSRNFGLLRYDGTKRPAYGAFRTMTSSAGGTDSGTDSGTTKPPLKVKARPRSRGIKVRGTSDSGQVIRLSAYRYMPRRDRYSSARHRSRTRTLDTGRYRRLIPRRQLNRGRWKVVARTSRGDRHVVRRTHTRWPR